MIEASPVPLSRKDRRRIQNRIEYWLGVKAEAERRLAELGHDPCRAGEVTDDV